MRVKPPKHVGRAGQGLKVVQYKKGIPGCALREARLKERLRSELRIGALCWLKQLSDREGDVFLGGDPRRNRLWSGFKQINIACAYPDDDLVWRLLKVGHLLNGCDCDARLPDATWSGKRDYWMTIGRQELVSQARLEDRPWHVSGQSRRQVSERVPGLFERVVPLGLALRQSARWVCPRCTVPALQIVRDVGQRTSKVSG